MTRKQYIASLPLPPYAMQFDGFFFENEIDGYRTLTINGRETLESEITAIERISDGALYRSKRNISRTLTVGFMIAADSITDLRNQINRLDCYLNHEQVKVVFSDEPDKFYIGTKSTASYDLSGYQTAVGTIEIYCADPHKYSVAESELTADANNEFNVFYDGTYKAYPKFEAVCASDNGFISYVNQTDDVILLGDPSEEDLVQEDTQETLIDYNFRTDGVDNTWTLNSATVESNVSQYVQEGTVTYTANSGLKANTFGSTTTTWHGPSITKLVPADSGGHVGAKNFDMTFGIKFYSTGVNQKQEVMIICTGTVNNVKTAICSIHVHKMDTSGYNATVRDYVMGERKNSISFNATSGNEIGVNAGWGRIRKTGDRFTFEMRNMATFETTVAGTEDYEVTEVSIFMCKDKTIAAMDMCAISYVKFTSYGVDWDDVQNKFTAGDAVSCDCESGEIMVNDGVQYGLGAIDNDWENFYLRQGWNKISCHYSDWATSPTFKMRFRKAYL